MEKNLLERLAEIELLAFDIDGVLTDGTLLVTESGEQQRTFNVKDGLALIIAEQQGLNVHIVSSAKGQGVRKRMEYLKLSNINLEVKDKLAKVKEIAEAQQIEPEKILFMGDDLQDYDVMQYVGMAVAPKDACSDVLAIADYVSPFDGGKGAVRELMEKIMRLKGVWPIKR